MAASKRRNGPLNLALFYTLTLTLHENNSMSVLGRLFRRPAVGERPIGEAYRSRKGENKLGNPIVKVLCSFLLLFSFYLIPYTPLSTL